MGLAKDNIREYNRIHKWISRHWDKSGICEFCFRPCKTQWSNKSGKYIQDRIDWQELCPKCHVRYDKNVLGAKIGYQRAARPGYPLVRELRPELKALQWGSLESVRTRLETYAWYRSV